MLQLLYKLCGIKVEKTSRIRQKMNKKARKNQAFNLALTSAIVF